MGTVLAGIIGVGVGALITGGVAVTIAWRDRKRAGLVAARVMAAALSAASLRLGSMAKNREIGHPSEDWEAMMVAPWRDHRDNLAQVVQHPAAFEDVAAAFGIISSAISFRTLLFEAAEEEGGVPVDSPESEQITDILLGYKDTIDRVLPILHRASFSSWQWRKEERRLAGMTRPIKSEEPPAMSNQGI